MFRSNKHITALSASLLALSACASVSDAVKEPELTPLQNPRTIVGAVPVTIPQPAPPEVYSSPNSLWRTGARSFFKDQRASQVGDILTVDIDITDNASLSNSTATSRTGGQDASVSGLFGLDVPLERALPGASSLSNGLGTSTSSTSNGTGSVNRSESIQLSVAAVITDVLPNGNFILAGRQEVKVNSEVRELIVSGIIRPEDISATNTISHTQLAEARISYGGRGDITIIQRPRIGQRIAERVMPF